jgi:hypothetical protein
MNIIRDPMPHYAVDIRRIPGAMSAQPSGFRLEILSSVSSLKRSVSKQRRICQYRTRSGYRLWTPNSSKLKDLSTRVNTEAKSSIVSPRLKLNYYVHLFGNYMCKCWDYTENFYYLHRYSRTHECSFGSQRFSLITG